MTIEQIKSLLSDKVQLSETINVKVGRKIFPAKVSGVSLNEQGQAVIEYLADVPEPTVRAPKAVKAAISAKK